MKITTFELLNLLVCQASTSFVCPFMERRLRTCSLSVDSFISKLGDSVACRAFGVCNVVKVMRNYVCSRKRNFHVRISVDTVACHAVTVCKYANLHVVTQ